MTKFVANNLYTVEIDVQGDLHLYDEGWNDCLVEGFLYEEGIQALREYFMDEARKNGDIPFIYKTPGTDTKIVVVPVVAPDGAPENSRWVTVASPVMSTKEQEGVTRNAAAKAYFDANPAPPAWHEAKRGEIWSVEIDNWLMLPAMVVGSYEDLSFALEDGSIRKLDDSEITNAKLLFEKK